MTLDEYSTPRPTLQRWSNRIPKVDEPDGQNSTDEFNEMRNNDNNNNDDDDDDDNYTTITTNNNSKQ